MSRISFYMLMLFTIVSNTTIAQTKDERAVAAAVESLRKAMIDADRSALENLASGDLSYGHSNGRVETKNDFIGSLTSGKSDFVTMELSDQTIRVSGKTAIVRHTLSASINDDGKPGTVKLTVMLVWQKQHRQWKLLARQASRLI